MLCALVESGYVTEIKELDADQINELSPKYEFISDITDMNPMPEVGWHFDGMTFTPGEGQSATPTKKITRLAMRERFTFAELCAIHTTAKTNVYVEVLMNNLQVALYVDLNRPDTASGLGLLVQLGLLTQERMNQILTTPVAESERYKGSL